MALISATGKIHMVDLIKQHQASKEALDAAFASVMAHGAFINGPEVKLFATQLAEFLSSPHVIPCANGTDALQIALMALGLQPGDEVITTSFNYVAAAEAAALLGLVPVFAEVHPGTFNLDTSLLEQVITPKTKAIIAVHLFGQACDMEAVMAAAEKHGLLVIEDNAQSLGCDVTYHGEVRKAGTVGHLGTTSFFPTKNLGCMGDGGAIYTANEQLAAKCKSISAHGQGQRYEFQQIGVNSRLDTLQAALLSVKLKALPEALEKRKQVASQYRTLLAEIPEVSLPETAAHTSHSYNQFVIKVANGKRDALKNALSEFAIPTMVYYPKPLHLQPAFQFLNKAKGDFPVSEQLCEQVLALPVHPMLEDEQIRFICHQINRFFLA